MSGLAAALVSNQSASADAAAAETARAAAVIAQGASEEARDEAVAATAFKADIDGGNIVAPATFRENIDAAGISDLEARAAKAANGSDFSNLEVAKRNLGDFATRALGVAASIPAVLTSVHLRGYTAAGDGGGSLYTRAVSEPAHAAKFQSADGAWWGFAGSEIGPEHVGAAGVDQTVLFQAAMAASVALGIPFVTRLGKTYPVSNIFTPSGIDWRGGRAMLSMISGATGVMIRVINPESATIRDLMLVGGLTDPLSSGATEGARIGLRVEGQDTRATTIEGIYASGFDRSGIVAYDLGRESVTALTLRGCWSVNCFNGLHADELGEYVSATGCSGSGNFNGLRVTGGNFVGSALHFDYNVNNLVTEAGANNGHGYITASTFNHASVWGWKSDGVTEGFILSACAIYDCDVYWKNSSGLKFLGDMGEVIWYFEAGGRCWVIDNNVNGECFFNHAYNGTDSQVSVRNNHEITTGSGAPLDKPIYNLSDFHAVATSVVGGAIASGGDAALVFNSSPLVLTYSCDGVGSLAGTPDPVVAYDPSDGTFRAVVNGPHAISLTVSIDNTAAASAMSSGYLRMQGASIGQPLIQSFVLLGDALDQRATLTGIVDLAIGNTFKLFAGSALGALDINTAGVRLEIIANG